MLLHINYLWHVGGIIVTIGNPGSIRGQSLPDNISFMQDARRSNACSGSQVLVVIPENTQNAKVG
jgi:hypothetical protein